MTPSEFCGIASRLLRHPAAPGFEHAVRAEAEQICAENELGFSRDNFGTVLIRLKTKAGLRPLILAAHLDHPGFQITQRLTDRSWLGRFRGGVPDAYFVPGLPLRLLPGGVAAKLARRRGKSEPEFEIKTLSKPEVPPQFGVWELADFGVRKERIYARACDDLIGVAAVLAVLIDLKKSRAPLHVVGVLSRAEEIGFQGALALADSQTLARNSLVISLETSRELPGVRMGDGVIIRVGDRASIFDSKATRFLTEVATDLGLADRRFRFQRALMSGGTCEATAYQEYGYQCSAVCVALGNYHNCGPGNRIRAEYVSLADACGMVKLLAAAARRMTDYHRLTGRLSRRLAKLLRESKRTLPATR